MLSDLFWVAVGGGFGSAARYAIGQAFARRSLPISIPVATLFVNLLGSLLMGMLLRNMWTTMQISQSWHALLIVGFCGAFTTYSAFSMEAWSLLRGKKVKTAITYIVLSIGGSLLFFAIGFSF